MITYHNFLNTFPHLDREQDARHVPRLDGHGDVKVEADPELSLREDVAPAGADEEAALHALRAGDDAAAGVA